MTLKQPLEYFISGDDRNRFLDEVTRVSDAMRAIVDTVNADPRYNHPRKGTYPEYETLTVGYWPGWVYRRFEWIFHYERGDEATSTCFWPKVYPNAQKWIELSGDVPDELQGSLPEIDREKPIWMAPNPDFGEEELWQVSHSSDILLPALEATLAELLVSRAPFQQ